MLVRWPQEQLVAHRVFNPGKLPKKDYTESFNGNHRDEYLDEHMFINLHLTRELRLSG
ncbi:hypothetical protein [Oleiharenicola lentus]|uniref:hypothetical protein n=1 Tax=Oleiharenicola lentus TaxID=2508720 RepID=UPI0013E93996|nr:hypothetical protein [Oleiharenicola lentus]